jgi:hypothetical protein
MGRKPYTRYSPDKKPLDRATGDARMRRRRAKRVTTTRLASWEGSQPWNERTCMMGN